MDDGGRAILWYLGKLPPSQSPTSYVTHVSGPELHGGVKRPAYLHTMACLYHARGLYVVRRVSETEPTPPFEAKDAQQIIKEYEVPPAKLAEQQRLAQRLVPPPYTNWDRWLLASQMADEFGLPVAMFAISDTAERNERVVYLQTVGFAPLDTAVEAFKRAVSKINKS